MQMDSNMLLFGALILVAGLLIDIVVAMLTKRSIRNDRMSKMITMQQSAFRTEAAATLDRMRTTSKECEQNVEISVSSAADMVRQISDSLKTLSDYQEDLSALQAVCAEYKTALEKLRISTDQAEARISAVQQEVRKVEAVNDRMDSFRAEAERSLNQLQDLKAEYVRLVASTQESLKSAAEMQKSDNQDMLASFRDQIERAKELFASFVTQERMDFKAFSDSEMKKAEDCTIDTENRRSSIMQSLEEGKDSLEAFRKELEESVSSLSSLRDGIKGEGEAAAASFRESVEASAAAASSAAEEAIASARKALEELSASSADEIEKRKGDLSDNADALSGRIGALIKEQEADAEAFLEGKKAELENIAASIAERVEAEKHSLETSSESLRASCSEAEDNASKAVAEGNRNIEAARIALDGERSSFIEASRDAVSKSFAQMLEGVNQRYERIKSDSDAFIRAVADRINDTRETITLLTQGEQERIQDSVERLQELDRKIKASEEQLQELQEKITASREELFSAQQDVGRMDGEIEERNKELERLNDDMQKSKSARISEEAALVRLKLQIANLEKERRKAEPQAKEEPPVEEAPKKEERRKPEDMIEEFPDDIFTGNVEEVDLGDDES